MQLSIIVAVAENGVIGRDGGLPWHLGDDLRRFKRLTMGHTLIMGRRTWESIGRPLPGRRIVVVTRQAGYQAEGVETAGSIDAALESARRAGDEEAFVVGGAEIYAQTLPLATRLYLTRVRAIVDGDALFPDVDWGSWRGVSREHHDADAKNDFAYSFEVYEQVSRLRLSAGDP
jgi:dihydrofolate reductase